MVDWAMGLTVFSLFVIFPVAFLLAPAVGMVHDAVICFKMREGTRPPDSAPDAEKEEWDIKSRSINQAVHASTERSLGIMTLFVGLPLIGLLIVVCVILSRSRVRLIRLQ